LRPSSEIVQCGTRAVLALAMLAGLPPAKGADEAPPSQAEGAAAGSPWAFSLGLYTWLPAVDAKLASGNLESTVDESLADIFEATKGVPLSIGGRIEASWKRLGLFVDTSYFNLRFREQDIKLGNVLAGSANVSTQMAFVEYAAAFRVLGEPAGNRPKWGVESGQPRVDLYAGARTIWVEVDIEPETLPGSSTDKAVTSPLVGARAELDLGPRWFLRMDGSVGGFDVEDVELAAEGLAAVGFRMTPLRLRTELWLGYEVLYLEVEKGGALRRLESETLFHGPALGLTLSW